MISNTFPVIAIFLLLLIAFPVLSEALACFLACYREIGSDMIRWQRVGVGAPGVLGSGVAPTAELGDAGSSVFVELTSPTVLEVFKKGICIVRRFNFSGHFWNTHRELVALFNSKDLLFRRTRIYPQTVTHTSHPCLARENMTNCRFRI